MELNTISIFIISTIVILYIYVIVFADYTVDASKYYEKYERNLNTLEAIQYAVGDVEKRNSIVKDITKLRRNINFDFILNKNKDTRDQKRILIGKCNEAINNLKDCVIVNISKERSMHGRQDERSSQINKIKA